MACKITSTHPPLFPLQPEYCTGRTVHLPKQGGWGPCYLHHRKDVPHQKRYCPGRACPAVLYGSVPTDNRALYSALFAKRRLLLHRLDQSKPLISHPELPGQIGGRTCASSIPRPLMTAALMVSSARYRSPSAMRAASCSNCLDSPAICSDISDILPRFTGAPILSAPLPLPAHPELGLDTLNNPSKLVSVFLYSLVARVSECFTHWIDFLHGKEQSTARRVKNNNNNRPTTDSGAFHYPMTCH